MELQDVYNDKKQKQDIIKTRDNFNNDEFSMSTFIWIVNDSDMLLMQKRTDKDDNKPGTWNAGVGGSVETGEDSLEAAVRELKEELNIEIIKDKLIYVGTERRKRKFFEYYFLDLDIEKIEFNKEEVQDIKWITFDEYKNTISNAVNFQMLKNFYFDIYKEKPKTSLRMK